MRWPSAIEWVLGVLAVVAIGAFLWSFDPFGRRKHAETVAHAAVAQTQVATAATQAVDHYTEHTTIIRERADRAVDQIQSAPGADAPLDPAFRDQLCASLGELRNGPVCTDDHRPQHVP